MQGSSCHGTTTAEDHARGPPVALLRDLQYLMLYGFDRLDGHEAQSQGRKNRDMGGEGREKRRIIYPSS